MSQSGNQEPNAIPLYNRSLDGFPVSLVNTLEFCRYRWRFRTKDAVRFPPGTSGNLIRGAFGLLLREIAPPAVYRQIFEPGRGSETAPSGLVDWPRPFLFRTEGLDGVTVPPQGSFHIDMHWFDVRSPFAELFHDVFRQFAQRGLGPGRGRAELVAMELLDLEDRPAAGPSVIALDPPARPTDTVRVRFVTPTELKAGGELVRQPDFAILFARLRDRVSTLRALYGVGPLAIDFRALGERAAAVRMVASSVAWERVERKSSRTGQVHWQGGFTGEAEYAGELGEFVPWLEAARWTGVGRQTVWGKGDVRVVT